MKNPNKPLIDVLVESGISEDEATWATERVLNAIPVALAAGKSVRLPGVSDLRPRRKWVYVPGSCDKQKREEVKVTMRACSVWKGEAIACDPPAKPKVTFSSPRALA